MEESQQEEEKRQANFFKCCFISGCSESGKEKLAFLCVYLFVIIAGLFGLFHFFGLVLYDQIYDEMPWFS